MKKNNNNDSSPLKRMYDSRDGERIHSPLKRRSSARASETRAELRSASQIGFKGINEDILNNVTSYLYSNNDMLNLMSTCKYMYSIIKKNGFLKNMLVSIDTDYRNIFCTIKNNLYSLTVKHFMEPLCWIPFKWPKIVNFYNCIFKQKIDNQNKTKELNIYSQYDIEIDFKKFKHLEILNLHVSDVRHLDKIKYCTKLKKICLNLKNKNRVFPKSICTFRNLEVLLSNLKANDQLHFESKILKTMYTRKNVVNYKAIPWTTNSKLIKNHHLTHSFTSNLAAFTNSLYK